MNATASYSQDGASAFWQDVKREMRNIPGFKLDEDGAPVNDAVFLTSVVSPATRRTFHKAGVVVEATRHLAAQCLVNGSHRLATPEEIAAYKQTLIERGRELAQIELARKQTAILVASPEVTAAVNAAARPRKENN